MRISAYRADRCSVVLVPSARPGAPAVVMARALHEGEAAVNITADAVSEALSSASHASRAHMSLRRRGRELELNAYVGHKDVGGLVDVLAGCLATSLETPQAASVTLVVSTRAHQEDVVATLRSRFKGLIPVHDGCQMDHARVGAGATSVVTTRRDTGTEVKLVGSGPTRCSTMFASFEVAAHMVGGPAGSHLFRTLRAEGSATYDVACRLGRDGLSGSWYEISFVVDPASAAWARQATQSAVSNLLVEPDFDARVAATKALLRTQADLLLDAVDTACQTALKSSHCPGPGWILRYPGEIAAVTSSDARGALNRFFTIDLQELA